MKSQQHPEMILHSRRSFAVSATLDTVLPEAWGELGFRQLVTGNVQGL